MTQFGMKQIHELKSGEILSLKEATLFFVCQPEKKKQNSLPTKRCQQE